MKWRNGKGNVCIYSCWTVDSGHWTHRMSLGLYPVCSKEFIKMKNDRFEVEVEYRKEMFLNVWTWRDLCSYNVE